MAGKRVPTYRLHKPSGQAVVTLDGKDRYLGIFGSPESRRLYASLISEWQQGSDSPPQDVTIAQLAMLYVKRCERHYVKGGEPTSELSCLKLAIRPLLKLYRKLPAREFTPKMLGVVRNEMIRAEYVRTSINRHVGRIRRMFKWAAAEGIVRGTVYRDLETLQGLQEGRTQARESDPVKPVPEAWIDAVEPYVSRPVWGMIQMQLATGMRPGEVRIMRGCDLKTSGEIWEYTPASHKTEHHGKGRVVAIGPAGQAILRKFLKPDLQAFLFSPRDVRKGRAGEKYSQFSYGKAIARGCRDATENLREQAKKDGIDPKNIPEIPAWSPNQLRHNFATRARREFGIEAARVTLGHSSAVTSEIYAERDLDAARAVVAKIG